MRDILLPKGMCSKPRDLFKCREIRDNNSFPVQNRDKIAMDD